MTKVTTYEDLRVWQKAMMLVREVYAVTEIFPKKEQYRLVDQLCRAAISVPSNIAEGSARRSTKEYIRFINIAYGSVMECETQLRIACDLNYLDRDKMESLITITKEIGRMLNALYSSLKSKLAGSFPPEAPEYRILNTEYQEIA